MATRRRASSGGLPILSSTDGPGDECRYRSRLRRCYFDFCATTRRRRSAQRFAPSFTTPELRLARGSPSRPRCRNTDLSQRERQKCVLGQPHFPGSVRAGPCYLVARRRVVPVSTIVERLQSGETIPKDWVALTFDDGYADNAHVALPILGRFQLQASFYVPTAVVAPKQTTNPSAPISFLTRWKISSAGPLDPGASAVSPGQRSDLAPKLRPPFRRHPSSRLGASGPGNRWTPDVCQPGGGSLRSIASNTVATLPPAEALRLMKRMGMEIGSHSVTHTDLAQSSRDDVRRELHDSRKRLNYFGRSGCRFRLSFRKEQEHRCRSR